MDTNKYLVSCDEIVKGVFLGNEASSQNIEFLRKHNIGLIVNCTKHIPFADTNAIKIRIPINDPGKVESIHQEDNTIMRYYAPHIIEFIDYYVNNHQNVLIHCHAGMQRSAAICALYLSKYKYNDTTDPMNRSVQQIISRRPIAFNRGTNINFLPVLLFFSKQ